MAAHETRMNFVGIARDICAALSRRERPQPPIVSKRLAGIVVLVTKMPVNSRENVALNQHPSSVVPHHTMCKRTNGMCSTIGKPHASSLQTLLRAVPPLMPRARAHEQVDDEQEHRA